MVLPILANWGTRRYQESKRVQNEEEIQKYNLNESDQAFLKRIRNEITLPVYDIFTDYCEMATQFGFLLLFSCAWPLSPFVCFVNNFVELRSDAAKLCEAHRYSYPP
jgi:anoctamin-10